MRREGSGERGEAGWIIVRNLLGKYLSLRNRGLCSLLFFLLI